MALASGAVWRSEQGIPVRNLWLLMFYASELRHVDKASMGTEKQPDELPDMVAEMLCHFVERRLRQNLSQGYVEEQAIRSRVRGQVDVLKSERLGLFLRGQVACRYQDLTIDTQRNRYVRGALSHLAGLASAISLRKRCRMLAVRLEQFGVVGPMPTRGQLLQDRFGRHDQEDRPMVAAAQLALELRIPTEDGDRELLVQPSREESWLRSLFERAVAGLYEVALRPKGWIVRANTQQSWPVQNASVAASGILPRMVTDITLDDPLSKRRIIVDTKFASVLIPNQYGQDKLKSEYLYQIYTYLRTQENENDPFSVSAEGLLLHPSIDVEVDEEVTVQGHRIRFATVNLAAQASEIRREVLMRGINE